MPTKATTGAVLALDLGTYCGWAVRSLGGQVTHGEKTFDKKTFDNEGARLFRFFQWLRMMIRHHQIKHLRFEDVQFQSSQLQTRLWSGWLTCVLVVAEFEGISVKGYPTGTVKLTASGHGSAGKPRMQVAAQSHFGLPSKPEENEADALCVLYVAELDLAGKLALPSKKKKAKRRPSKKAKGDPQAALEFLKSE